MAMSYKKTNESIKMRYAVLEIICRLMNEDSDEILMFDLKIKEVLKRI